MLKKRDGNKSRSWTDEELKGGFEYYFRMHKHYPTALDIDNFEYLPTSRSIQRNYGGLETLRSRLGLKVSHYGKGKQRAGRSGTIINRSFQLEEQFYDFLKSHFKPVFIHEQRPIRPQNLRVDYFIFTDPSNKNINNQGFIIDIFYADNRHNLRTIVNIKLKKYKQLDYKTHFVVIPAKTDIDQDYINSMHFEYKFGTNICIYEMNYYRNNFLHILKENSIPLKHTQPVGEW